MGLCVNLRRNLNTFKKLAVAAMALTLLGSGVMPAAASTNAFTFSLSTVGNANYHSTGFDTDFKGFNTGIFGTNHLGINISWSVEWYGCASKPAMKSNGSSLSTPAGTQVANEAAIDAALSADGCVALPLSGSKDATATTSNSIRAKYSYEEFDASGFAFVTAKVEAAYTGRTTIFTILTGAERPFDDALPTVSVLGNVVSATPGTYSGTYAFIENRALLCDVAISGQRDASSYIFLQSFFNGQGCVSALAQAGGLPTELSDMYTFSDDDGPNVKLERTTGHMVVVSSVDSTVFAWTNSVDISSASVPALSSPTPYTGPVLSDFSTRTLDPCTATAVTINGSNLLGATATIQGKTVTVLENTSNKLVLAFPAGLAAKQGEDLVVASNSGTLRFQNAFDISSDSCATSVSKGRWTQLQADGQTVKMYAKDPISDGKVQFFVNGKELAWITAVDESDPKLSFASGSPYLVRSVTLSPGKNRFEILVDGERVWRATYVPKG